MVQVRLKVGTAQKGSMKAVAGSGMASMSEASMLFQPRMLEPSKPSPSSKISSVISLMGQLKCCQVPKVSTNLMSTIRAPAFLASSSTLLGVLIEFSFLLNTFPEIWFRKRKSNSDRFFASLFGSDTNRIFNGTHKNLPVADLPRLGGFDDRIHRRLRACVREHNLEF